MPPAAMPVSRAASRRPDVVDALLTDALRGARPECLVVFGAGGGISDLVEAAEAGRTVVADRSIVHTRAASEALASLDRVEVITSDGSSHLDTTLRADAVAIRAPREKQVARQLIHDAFEALRPGGRLYLAGALRDGMKPYLEYASGRFGGMQPLAMRKGCRVALGVRPEAGASFPGDDPLLDHRYFHRFNVELRGHAIEVQSRPGVFAWDRLDDGTRALVGTIEVEPGDRVLDLGCGNGLIGVVAARLAPGVSVTMVDADVVAVEAARRTAAANGIEGCEVRLDDGASALPDAAFDVVAVNPPFHLDRATDTRTAERLIEDAHRVLRPGGRLFLVANRFLPYDRPIVAAFGHCHTASEDRSYRVFRAEKGRHA
ncbi:MAG: methyltransferase [Dehalococcoidia bacterium]